MDVETDSFGTTSAMTPRSRRRADVASPIAATRVSRSARASSDCAVSRSKTASTAFALVKTTHRYREKLRTASSSSAVSSSGRTSMVGASMGSAPSDNSSSDSALAWLRERVTSTRLPNRGRESNQFSLSRRRTTSPMTTATGGPMSDFRALPTMSASVPTTVRW